jgi:hypothetical protein
MDAASSVDVMAATDPRALEQAQIHGERWRHGGSDIIGSLLVLGARCPYCGIEVAVMLPPGRSARETLALLTRAGRCLHTQVH